MGYTVKWDGVIHKESFSACFKSYRLRLGLSHSEFAERAGICRSTVSNIECGYLILCTDEAVKRCVSALGLSESEEAELMGMFPKRRASGYCDRHVPWVWDGEIHTGSLGECLKSYRQRAGMSQTDLEKKSGVPGYYISKIEHGKLPSDDTLKELADALGLSGNERRVLFSLSEQERNKAATGHTRWNGELNTESFGAYLKSLRERAGLYQAELAGRAGTSQTVVSLAERGLCCVPGDVAEELADALDVSEEERKLMRKLNTELAIGDKKRPYGDVAGELADALGLSENKKAELFGLDAGLAG